MLATHRTGISQRVLHDMLLLTRSWGCSLNSQHRQNARRISDEPAIFMFGARLYRSPGPLPRLLHLLNPYNPPLPATATFNGYDRVRLVRNETHFFLFWHKQSVVYARARWFRRVIRACDVPGGWTLCSWLTDECPALRMNWTPWTNSKQSWLARSSV